MVRLGVNIDHVATIRQVRQAAEPDPVWAAVEAELGGADGITVHLREDRRHIIDRDVHLLKNTVAGKLNLEMACAADIVDLACELQPDQCCLVPERRAELTTEGGLDVAGQADRLSAVVKRLQAAGVTSCAFIEPLAAQVDAAATCGFDAVELWTGGYAHAAGEAQVTAELARLEAALAQGTDLGLEVHAGHGLTYRNVARLAALRTSSGRHFVEFNIGHSIVARAVLVGMRAAVREMKALLGPPHAAECGSGGNDG